MKSWQLPIDSNRQPITWVNPYIHNNVTWIDPYEFEDTLEFVSIARGRSAVNFVFKSITDGRKYYFGPAGFVSACKITKVTGIIGGFTITGRFGFVKRGQNYLTEAVSGG